MTDRIRSFTVLLERDFRDDDLDGLLALIRNMKGVADVLPRVVNSTEVIARETVRSELHGKVLQAVNAVFKDKEES